MKGYILHADNLVWSYGFSISSLIKGFTNETFLLNHPTKREIDWYDVRVFYMFQEDPWSNQPSSPLTIVYEDELL